MPAGATQMQMQSLLLDGNGVGVNHPLGYRLVARDCPVGPLPLFCTNVTNGAVG